MSMRQILSCIKKADIEYDLISEGDRICVGISGGKDSMVLLEALRRYRFLSKKNYEIIGVNIIMGFPNSDFSSIINFCNNNGIEFHQEPSNPLIYEVLKLHIDNKNQLMCSICSKMRKAAICNAAHKYNCNKIAFAHHGDDAVETLLLNMIYGGRIATFKPKTFLDRENIVLIRPLVYARERQIVGTVLAEEIPVVKSACPNDKNTQREEMKKMLNNLYKAYPSSRNNFLHMLSNLDHLDLWEKQEESEDNKEKSHQ